LFAEGAILARYTSTPSLFTFVLTVTKLSLTGGVEYAPLRYFELISNTAADANDITIPENKS
jgi:hypothetical protein